MDFVVQKAVELGVRRIQPVAAKRSVIRLAGERAERRVEHWRNVAIAACEQSGRNRVPAVAPILDLTQYLGMAAQENGLRLVCAPGVAVRLRDLAPAEAPISLLVGPEGGSRTVKSWRRAPPASMPLAWDRACCVPKPRGWAPWRQ
jgi:16S rRNA (uracil1498-N3)-methyltransferase